MDSTFFRVVIAISGLLLIGGLFMWEWLHKRALKKTEEVVRQQRQQQLAGEEPFELEQMNVEKNSEELELPSITASRSTPEVIEDNGPAPHSETNSIPNVIQVSVVAANNEQFNGNELLDALETLGLALGEMGIYHRHFDPLNDNRFSAANLVEPGIFPSDKEKTFSTPGIVLFLELSEQNNPLVVFDELVQTANHLADRLNGILLDGKHQALAEETLLELRKLIATK
jgi:cell division protein ZipA